MLAAVVPHLDEVASGGRAAVKIAFLGGARHLVAAGRAIDVAATGRERFENRIEALHDVRFAANHLAIAAFESPYAAAGADVTTVDSLGGEVFRAADVIDVIRNANIGHGVTGFEFAHQIV